MVCHGYLKRCKAGISTTIVEATIHGVTIPDLKYLYVYFG